MRMLRELRSSSPHIIIADEWEATLLVSPAATAGQSTTSGLERTDGTDAPGAAATLLVAGPQGRW